MYDEDFGLANVLRALRSELERAIADGEGSELRFELGDVEVELEVGVERERGVSGGLRFWVVSADASGTKARHTTHRVTLALRPSATTLIGDERPRP